MTAIHLRRTGCVPLAAGALLLALGGCQSAPPQPVGAMAAALPHCRPYTSDQVLRMDIVSQLVWLDEEIETCEKEPALKAQDYLLRGFVQTELPGKGPDLAIQDLGKAIELQPDNPLAYAARAAAKVALGRYADALPDASKAIELDPTASAYNNRAQIYAALGDPETAIADYTRSIALDPNRAGSYQGRGLLYARIGEANQALADLVQSMQLDAARIAAWQKALATLKYYNGPQNGVLDKALETSLRRWIADGMPGISAGTAAGE